MHVCSPWNGVESLPTSLCMDLRAGVEDLHPLRMAFDFDIDLIFEYLIFKKYLIFENSWASIGSEACWVRGGLSWVHTWWLVLGNTEAGFGCELVVNDLQVD